MTRPIPAVWIPVRTEDTLLWMQVPAENVMTLLTKYGKQTHELRMKLIPLRASVIRMQAAGKPVPRSLVSKVADLTEKLIDMEEVLDYADMQVYFSIMDEWEFPEGQTRYYEYLDPNPKDGDEGVIRRMVIVRPSSLDSVGDNPVRVEGTKDILPAVLRYFNEQRAA